MKIVHCIHGFFPESWGGTESYLRELATAQQRTGGEVTILCGSFELSNPATSKPDRCDGLDLIRIHRSDLYFDHWQKAYCPDAEVLVRKEFARLKPDVVHIHHWIRLTNNLAQVAAELKIPVVISLHDLYATCPRCFRLIPEGKHCDQPLGIEPCRPCVPRWKWQDDEEIVQGIALYKETLLEELSLAAAVLTPHRKVSELVARTLGFPLERMEAAGLCYEPRLGKRPQPPEIPPGEGEPLRLGCWGVFARHKGLHVLLQALHCLAASGAPPHVLHLFGKIVPDRLEREMRDLVEGLPVTFHGVYSLEQIAAARLHLAVIPSPCFETFCFVLDEAHELGLPVVVSDLGALSARAGPGGLCFAPGDANDLARVLSAVLASPDQLAARTGLKPTLPESPKKHAERVLRVYDEALARGPGKASAPDRLRQLRLEFLRRESNFRRALALIEMEAHVAHLEEQIQAMRKGTGAPKGPSSNP
jgi:glycosyltransferase involved in cell wall biosynthesis